MIFNSTLSVPATQCNAASVDALVLSIGVLQAFFAVCAVSISLAFELLSADIVQTELEVRAGAV